MFLLDRVRVIPCLGRGLRNLRLWSGSGSRSGSGLGFVIGSEASVAYIVEGHILDRQYSSDSIADLRRNINGHPVGLELELEERGGVRVGL